MNEPNDPLETLSAAWREATPPEATATVDAPDETTRATVEWLRDAWRTSAPPRVIALPWRLRARPVVRRAVPWLAAAAAIVLALSQLPSREAAVLRQPDEMAAVPRDRDAPPAIPPEVREAPLAPQLVSIEPDRMEMRSGNVRLILLTPTAPSPGTLTSPRTPADDAESEDSR